MQSWISNRKSNRIVGEWYSTTAPSGRAPSLTGRRLQLAWHAHPAVEQARREPVRPDSGEEC